MGGTLLAIEGPLNGLSIGQLQAARLGIQSEYEWPQSLLPGHLLRDC